MVSDIIETTRKITWRRIFVFVGVFILIILAAYVIAASQEYFRARGSDFFSIWLAPRLLIEGKNPYNPDDWVPAHDFYGSEWVSDPTFLYPLPLAILLLPLGLLPLEYASVFWVALTIFAILITCRVILAIWHQQWSIAYIIPILIGIFLFRSVAENLRLGQIDWLILLCLAIGLYFWEKQKWLAGGMIMGLTVLKPQIGLPLLGFLSIWLIIRRRWSALIGEGIVITGLFAVGWIFNHTWLSEWLNIGISKTTYNYCCTPTIFGLASFTCKFNLNCGFTIGAVLAIFISIILILKLISLPINDARFVLGFSIPVALLVSPYLWVYSQMVLIIPILMLMIILTKRQFPYLVVATFPLVISLFASGMVLLSIRVGVDVFSSMVPLVILVLLWIGYRSHTKRGISTVVEERSEY